MVRLEDYRIPPLEYFSEDDDAIFRGDGVHCQLSFDVQGRLMRVRAYLGQVVHGFPNLAGCPVIRLRVQPSNNSQGTFVNAPSNWRDPIVEQIGGVNGSW